MIKNDRRVAITGIGMITPLGMNSKDTWANLITTKSGIQKITRFDTSNLPCKIAGLIPYDNTLILTTSRGNEASIDPANKKQDVFMQCGIVATQEAIEDSGLDINMSEDIKNNTGVIIGSGIGGLQVISNNAVKFYAENNNRISPYFIPSSLSNLISGHVSIKYGFRGPNQSVTTACATGAHAIIDAMRIIKCNEANIMIAGGSEAAVTGLGVAGFAAIKALSTKYNDNPEAASRPWDKDRNGFVMAEGAAVVVLEELEHAKKRNANIYAEIVGYGLSSDAHHITAPHPEGIGGQMSMLNAIRYAQINAQDIDYINAHATSTEIGDLIELKAIKNVILNNNPNVAISSTKSSIGHLLGAAGSLEIIFSALALQNQVVPPTLNLDNPIDEVRGINLVPHTPQERKMNYVLSNAFGFGGTNASVILKRYV